MLPDDPVTFTLSTDADGNFPMMDLLIWIRDYGSNWIVAVSGVVGLLYWWDPFRKKEAFKIALECLSAVYAIRNRIVLIRTPYEQIESKFEGKPADFIEWRRSIWEGMKEYYKIQFERLQEERAKLQDATTKAEVLWGERLQIKFNVLDYRLDLLFICVNNYVAVEKWTLSVDDVKYPLPHDTDDWAVFRPDSPEDEDLWGDHIQQSIEDFERHLFPHLGKKWQRLAQGQQ